MLASLRHFVVSWQASLLSVVVLACAVAGPLPQAAAAAGADARALGATCASVAPLLWSVTKGNGSTSYLIGTYPLPFSSVSPLPDSVEQVLTCADLAFFQLPCSLAAGGGFGSFLTHCEMYPISDAQDSISTRLSGTDLSGVKAAFTNLIASAPASCTAAKTALQASVAQFTSTDFRIPLQTLYMQALQALDPLSCDLVGTSAKASVGLEETLRQRLTGKPIWGLEDISMECAMYQSNSVAEDQALGKKIVAEFSNDAWLANASATQSLMEEVIQCGDLSKLNEVRSGQLKLPRMQPTTMASRNMVLAKGVNTALVANPGKTIVFPLNVQHFLDVNVSGVASGGVADLLRDDGYTVTRIPGSVTCPKSALGGEGAQQQNKCTRPVMQQQPQSCRNFRTSLMAKLGNDTAYGRVKDKSNCYLCVNATETCVCEAAWSNTSDFQTLCTTLVVDGVKGEVLAMDLTRNPGSHRVGRANSQKTVRGLFMYCYATSCNRQLAEEEGLRQWYARDASLGLGAVTLRPWGTDPDADVPHSGVPSPLGGEWSPTTWVLAAVIIVGIVAMLVMCFRLPKRNPSKKNTMRGYNSNGMMTSDDGDSVNDPYEELKPLADSPQHQRGQEHDWQWEQEQQMQQEGQRRQQQEAEQRQQWEMQQRQQQQMQQQQQQQQHQQQQQQQMQMQMQQPPQQMPQGDAGLKVYDSSLLQQALQMQQALGDAGAQAVQQMQMHSLQGMQQFNQSTGPGSMGSGGHLAYGDAQARAFDMIDRNHDGVISRAEFQQMQQQQLLQMPGSPSGVRTGFPAIGSMVATQGFPQQQSMVMPAQSGYYPYGQPASAGQPPSPSLGQQYQPQMFPGSMQPGGGWR